MQAKAYKYQGYTADAVQVTAEMRRNLGPFPEWALPRLKATKTEKIGNSERIYLDNIAVMDGDWILKRSDGRMLVFPDELFKATYGAP
jgi:hypothetical protein